MTVHLLSSNSAKSKQFAELVICKDMDEATKLAKSNDFSHNVAVWFVNGNQKKQVLKNKS